MRIAATAVLLALSASPTAGAQERRIPFWPDALPETLRRYVDGGAILETVRELGRFHRVHGSPGFAAAAEHLKAKLERAGLADVTIERLPADGTTRYAHFRSYLGWNPVEASLEEVSPAARTLARFPDLPVALADYSQDADVEAQLVDVGPGTDPAHYEGKKVAGRIVLASGALPTVHRRACEERGALGFLSDFPNQKTAWSGDDRDLVRWGHLSPFQTRNTFAFMLSKRQSGELRARLAGGVPIVLRAHVRARMVPATYDLLSAVLRGRDPGLSEVLLTAHLCHQSSGANDDASGSAAIFEVARALQAAVRSGALPRPRRSIRFLWAPEIAGSQAWLIRHPDLARKLEAGIHMDMVGGLLATTRGTFHLSRSAETVPHVVNEIARAWFEDVVRSSARHAERGGDPERGLVWPGGSREVFLGDIRPLEMGSDHQVFEEATFRVPMAYFHDWPDVTIHTHKDLPENLDATKLGRVAYLGAGIAWTLGALPDAEAGRLRSWVAACLEERAAQARLRSALGTDAWDGSLFPREAAAVEAATWASLDRLWPAPAARPKPVPPVRSTASAPRRDARVPIRDPGVRGGIDVYYYDHVTEVLGPDAPTETALTARENGGVLAFETLNLVDGTRSVAEIRDVLAGRYEPVPVGEVGEYLELLARAKVVSFR